MELALEFWSLLFQFWSNASTNLLVLVAKYPGVSWDPLGLAWVSLGPFWASLGTPWDPCMDQIHGSDPWKSQKNRTIKMFGNHLKPLETFGNHWKPFGNLRKASETLGNLRKPSKTFKKGLKKQSFGTKWVKFRFPEL